MSTELDMSNFAASASHVVPPHTTAAARPAPDPPRNPIWPAMAAGRIVHKYFEGYGNFLGMVKRKVPGRPVVEVAYEDGDGEEIFLDQLLFNMLPENTM